jgi:hypothetical protein
MFPVRVFEGPDLDLEVRSYVVELDDFEVLLSEFSFVFFLGIGYLHEERYLFFFPDFKQKVITLSLFSQLVRHQLIIYLFEVLFVFLEGDEVGLDLFLQSFDSFIVVFLFLLGFMFEELVLLDTELE